MVNGTKVQVGEVVGGNGETQVPPVLNKWQCGAIAVGQERASHSITTVNELHSISLFSIHFGIS